MEHPQKYHFDIVVGGENSFEGAFLPFKKLKLRFLESFFSLKKMES